MVSQYPTTPESPAATYGAILDSATEVFMESGFSGARVEEIARRASANKAMIYYHFGSKQELYRAVLTRLFAPVIEEIGRLQAKAEPPDARLRALYGRIAEHFAATRALPHIMLREILAGGQAMDAEASRTLMAIIGFVATTLAEGVQKGVFRPVDPILLHMTVMGPLLLHSAGGAFRERLRQQAAPAIKPPDAAALVSHLLVVLDRALAPEPGVPHPPSPIASPLIR